MLTYARRVPERKHFFCLNKKYLTFLFKLSTNVRISVNVQRRVGMAQKAVKTAARTERLESTQNVPKVPESKLLYVKSKTVTKNGLEMMILDL